jgi:hypothetical protein
MEAATKVNWNDDRIDRFSEQVDGRFDKLENHVEARFNRLEDRFDLLQNSLIISLAGILAAFAALFAAANF